MLEDGTAPVNRVAIQRVCGTSQRTEGYTDSRGYFSFQLGSNTSELIQDASSDSFGLGRDPLSTPTVSRSGSSTGTMEQRLMGCELRAQLPGYQSQAVSLSNRQPMDNPDLGVILLHRLGASDGTTVSATTLAAPKDARKAYEKGLAFAKKNKFDEAQTELQKAVMLYPHYALAWCDLGKVQASLGKLDEARKSFDQSIQADQKYVPPYIDIARLQLRAKQWQELADTSGKAVKLDPFSYPDAFFWNAVANYNLHNISAAEESARRAQKLDTRHQIPQVSHLLGVILADRREYSGDAEQMRAYLKFAPGAQDAGSVRSQLEEIEKLAQGTPRAASEQGPSTPQSPTPQPPPPQP